MGAGARESSVLADGEEGHGRWKLWCESISMCFGLIEVMLLLI